MIHYHTLQFFVKIACQSNNKLIRNSIRFCSILSLSGIKSINIMQNCLVLPVLNPRLDKKITKKVFFLSELLLSDLILQQQKSQSHLHVYCLRQNFMYLIHVIFTSSNLTSYHLFAYYFLLKFSSFCTHNT